MWGWGGYTPSEICFSRSSSECSWSQNINCLNRCDFYSRTTEYFRLIARDDHPTNFGCINVSSIDLWVSLIYKLRPPPPQLKLIRMPLPIHRQIRGLHEFSLTNVCYVNEFNCSFSVDTNYYISVHGLSCSLISPRLVLWSQCHEVMRVL